MQGSFRNLQVWRRAKQLAVRIYALTEKGGLGKDRNLREQMRRASISIASNIAEGNERGTDRDACRYLYVAKASIGELLTQLEIATEIELAIHEDTAPLIKECEELARMMRALIDYRSGSLPSRPSPLAPRPSNG